ncbi:ABC transporter substrate-binding protein [Ruminococcus hominis]|uniref:ABC transporter substrate-binding protein n=1 Tax=Ruminococcus hominis TaxID=2763065 RepID=A0ABR7G676_9FIRM|nr:ABC transporter substrate-binding protein [Ruminococcus hominis]MBC5682935.1 ABC transporter substrate-binding protein [Ruminococcus hominis]
MKAKKVMAMAMASAMILSLTACGGSSSDSSSKGDSSSSDAKATVSVVKPNQDAANTEKTDETLTIGLSSEPSSLYGAAGGKTENEEQIIGNAMLDSLVKFNYATNELEPSLATDWEWVDDTHLKFTLRDDVTMSDGTPLVADDVVYTCNKIWIEQNTTNDTGKYIKGATADDEHTVTIEFNTTAPDFLKMMSWTNFGIVSEDEVNAAGGLDAVQTNPVIGSGPYKFKEWKNGQSVTLERNDNYWDKDYAGYYKEIVFTFTSDAAAREMAVESGDADIAYDMPVSQAATYAENDSVNTTIYDFGQTTHLWYNMGDNAGATKDQKVREAIDKALDFDAIAQVGTAGFGEAALSYWDPSCDYYTANYTKEERAVDVDGAKELLDEAGYGDGVEITALGLQDNTPVLTVMQANLAEAGITLKIDTPDTAQFVEGAFGGDYDLICVGDTPAIRTPASVMPFLQKLNVDGPGMVIGGAKWTSDEFDSTITDLISESDTDKATELATKLDEMVKDETVCSNLYPEMKASVYAKDLKGFNTSERGFVDATGFYE